jgi:hypothetical protein
VLDLACGKGGDLDKFKKHNVTSYVGSDIAINSLHEAVERVQKNTPTFTHKFIRADLGEHSLVDSVLPHWAPHFDTGQQTPIPKQFREESGTLKSTTRFDLVSMQVR